MKFMTGFINLKSVKRLLIQRADRLGDVIFSLPVIEAIKREAPHVKIDFLTSAVGFELLDGHPHVDRVYVINVHSDDVLVEFIRLISVFSQHRYDVYLSLWNHPLLAKIGVQCGIPNRVGDATDFLLKTHYNFPVLQQWHDFTQHQVDFNMKLLDPFLMTNRDIKPAIYVQSGAKKYADTYIRKRFGSSLKIVFIFYGTGGSNLTFPEDVLIDFIKRLLQNELVAIVLGGSNETILVSDYQQLMCFSHERFDNVVGKTTLQELMALIDVSHYYVGGDTGPSHIASFLNKPMIFFSPMKSQFPTRWGPFSTFSRTFRNDYYSSHSFLQRPTLLQLKQSMSGKQLVDLFCQLTSSITFSSTSYLSVDRLNPVQRRLFYSVRVLYVIRNKRQLEEIVSLTHDYRQYGFMVFPFYFRLFSIFNWIRFFNVISERNITVIQGRIPFLLKLLLVIYVGVIKRYVVPIVFNFHMNSYIGFDDYLRVYSRIFKKRVKMK